MEHTFDPLKGVFKKEAIGDPIHQGIEMEKAPPFLRALLVTDGTVTKFLEAYLWEPIEVRKLFQQEVSLEADVDWLELRKGSQVLKRQVLLEGTVSRKVYTFAESLIRLDRLSRVLRQEIIKGRLGIGELLRDQRLETYREMLHYGTEASGVLSDPLGIRKQDPLLFRHYRIFTKYRPAILVTEKFPIAHFL